MAKLPTNAEKETTVDTADQPVKSDDVSLAAMLASLQSLQSELFALKAQNDELQKQIVASEPVVLDTDTVAERQDYRRADLDRVKIRLNAYAMLHAEMPSLNLRMTEFGETRTITLSEFQQLVGLHPNWFKNEYLLVDASRMDLVEDYPITVYDPQSTKFVHAKDIGLIGKMDTTELRNYYNALSPKSQQGFIMMFMRKCYDEDPDFYSIEKMEAVNSMSKSKTFNVLIRQLNEKQGNGSGEI